MIALTSITSKSMINGYFDNSNSPLFLGDLCVDVKQLVVYAPLVAYASKVVYSVYLKKQTTIQIIYRFTNYFLKSNFEKIKEKFSKMTHDYQDMFVFRKNVAFVLKKKYNANLS